MAALNVLVVEDDAIIGILLAEMLGDMGYNVCAVAATEDDAVADAARCKPGLMIVDERLREGNGSSAVARILLDGPVPCVFISGAPLRFSRTEKTCCANLSRRRSGTRHPGRAGRREWPVSGRYRRRQRASATLTVVPGRQVAPG